MADALTLEDFVGRRGETFRVESDEGRSLAFELTAVAPLSDGRGDFGHRLPFSLEFLGPEANALPQASYEFTHDEMGRLDIFIVPIERVDNRLKYQAIFS
jgi:hypothetical protein